MAEFKLTREYVVQTVESLSGVNNIGEKTKKSKKLYLRYVAYALLDRYFPHSSLNWKAETFDQDHATVVYALKKWKTEILKQRFYKEYCILYSNCEFNIDKLLYKPGFDIYKLSSKLPKSIEFVQKFNKTHSYKELEEHIDILIKYIKLKS